jgi:hypothetical protein
MKNGSFGYRCVSDRDPVCSMDIDVANGLLKEMPPKVAVGATFGVAFKSESSAAQDGSAVIAPVSTALLASGEGATFTAQKPGFAGLLASRGSTVVDVVHVDLVAPDHVRIDTAGTVITGDAPIELGVGALLTLDAAAADKEGAVLAGSLEDAWASDEPAIAEVMTPSTTDTVTVRGAAPGQTSIRVTIGGMKGAVVVKVVDFSSGAGGAGGSP